MILLIIGILIVLLLVGKIGISSPKTIGKIGEKEVAHKLHWLPRNYTVLNDILLPTDYGTTQIDHIVVSPYGIFVIETKNYKGWIFGYENSREWKQSLLGKKNWFGWSSEQYKFRNPIRQNMAHTIAIKMLLKEIGTFTIIPIVVFSDDAYLNVTAPNHIVINWCNLRSVIKSYRTKCIADKDISIIVSKLQESNITDKKNRLKHISDLQITIQNNELAIANGICPKCGGNLVERKSQYGSFWGCSNFPNCRFTYNDN
ncbi:MAG: NERD domain-containing protein [Alistipes sp.]|nr:NERD domain-containing protein [Alistipes sp.]